MIALPSLAVRTRPRPASDRRRPEEPGSDRAPQETGGPAQPPLVRGQRPAFVRAPLAHGADGISPHRLRGQARHRHHQHLERHQSLPHAFPAARGGSEARHLAGGRLSRRDAGPLPRGAVPEAHDDALPQPPRDGNGGAAAQLSRGRLRAHGRLRQDDAGAGDGRARHEPAVDLRAGGADAARRLPRAAARQRQRLVEILGGAARRQHHAGGLAGSREAASRARRGIA